VQHASLRHTSPGAQVFGHVSVPPQPLGAVPQTTPTHAWAGVAGMQHIPASHTRPVPQLPQLTVPPHASFSEPQTAPSSWQSCESSRTFWHDPALQTSPVGQLPHWSKPPQPSLTVPQVRPSAEQEVLAQASQTWLTASQTWGDMLVPHSSGWPHPSLAAPHWYLSEVQLCGAQGPQA